MNRIVVLLAAIVVGAATRFVPAAATPHPVGDPEVLASAAAVGDTYVGWKVHVPQPGYFEVKGIGTSGAGVTILFIGLDQPRVLASVGGGPLATVGADGVSVTLPVPFEHAGRGLVHLMDGDYSIVATASGGPLSAARFVLTGPRTAAVTGALRGPTFFFTDADFGGGSVLVAPGVDQRRSVHGTVTVDVAHTLFASWASCPGATHSLQAPPAVADWPWATAAGVLWGQPGTWTFTLDAATDRLEPGSLEAPCTNHLVGFDLAVPASAVPEF